MLLQRLQVPFPASVSVSSQLLLIIVPGDPTFSGPRGHPHTHGAHTHRHIKIELIKERILWVRGEQPGFWLRAGSQTQLGTVGVWGWVFLCKKILSCSSQNA